MTAPRWLDSPESIMIVSLVAGVFGVIKIIFTEQKLPARYNAATLLVSASVGTIAGMVSLEAGFMPWISLSITAVSSLVSRDLVAALLDKKLTNDLIRRAAENIVDKTTK